MLGAMLVSGNAVATVSELLQPEDFYRRSHATIFRTILEMYGRGENVDSITLTNALSNRGLLDEVGGKAIVHTLAATVPSVANARHYAQIVRDTATYRGLIRAGTEIAELGFERIGEPRSWSTAPSRSCSGSPTSASPATSRTWRRCSSSRSTASPSSPTTAAT